MDIIKFEHVIKEGMKELRSFTLEHFGNPSLLNQKTQDDLGYAPNEGGAALTETDLYNQETLLLKVYDSFPEIAVSVEERVNNPTFVQAAFYKNDQSASWLMFLDPLDGTYAYREGKSSSYGIIASLVERVNKVEGRFASACVYYPTFDIFLLANERGVILNTCEESHRCAKEIIKICKISDSAINGEV